MPWSLPYQVIIPAYFSLALEWHLLCAEWTSACSSQLSLQIVEWVVTLSFSHSLTEASTYCFLDTWIFVMFFFIFTRTHTAQNSFSLTKASVCCVLCRVFFIWLMDGFVFLAMRSEVKASCCLDASLMFVHTQCKVKFSKPYYGISTIDRAHGDRVAYGVLWVWWHHGLGPWTLRNYSLFRYFLELIPFVWHKAVWESLG